MEHTESNPPGFDEDAALEKLEQLRQEIVRYRAKRKAVTEEFEAFVGSFKSRQTAPPVPPRVEETPSTPPVSLPPRPDSGAGPVVPLTPAPAPAVLPRTRVNRAVLAGGALLLLGAAGLITWMVRTQAPETPAAAQLPDARAPRPSAAPPPKPASQPAGPVSELTTTRRVWVRVIADGERIVEGELPANARVPLAAEKTVVIRAGNAAVVRLTLRGQDQGTLGPEGAVVTRSFTVPPVATR